MKKIFTKEQVDKFFDILDRLDRSRQAHYEGRRGLSSMPCQQEVFVARTVAKWFGGRCFKIIQEVKLGYEMKNFSRGKAIYKEEVRYISVGTVRYNYGRGQTLTVAIADAGKPSQIFEGIEMYRGGAHRLIGQEILRPEFNMVESLFKIEDAHCSGPCGRRMMRADIREDREFMCDKCYTDKVVGEKLKELRKHKK